MRQLVNFLNHGFLPYVGREREREKIAHFWQGTAEAHGLRTVLMTGEAGSGKSRFVEEMVPEITRSGGLVVHAKLYPEATTALAPLLAHALWRAAGASGLVRSEPEGTLASVIGACRRLCRLRQTLLVLEDIHLLSRQSLGDLATFLEGMADEPLSVFCASRQTELAIHGVLERYLVDEINLGGLGEKELEMLWIRLFVSEPEPGIIPLLFATTTGNVLAVRSALRGAMKSGALTADPLGGAWRTRLPAAAFAEALQQSVLLLSKGMAAHLSEIEHQSAVELARLGEIFSYEAACMICRDGERFIEILSFKGIIRLSTTMAPGLPGATTMRPLLAFSHTLLHRYFLQHRSSDPAAIIRLIAANAPLYSTLPFQTIEPESAAASSTPLEQQQAAERAIRTMRALNNSPDWELSDRIADAVAALLDRCTAYWSDEECTRVRLEFLNTRLLLAFRSHDDHFLALVEEFLNATDSIEIESLLHHRLSALAHKVTVVGRTSYELAMEYDRKAEAMADERPWLRSTESYLQYLRSIVMVARAENDAPVIRNVEDRVNAFLADPNVSEELRLVARRSTLLFFLDIFENEEELARRLAMLIDLEKIQGTNSVTFPWHRSILLYEIGEARQVVAHLHDVIPRLRDHGLGRSLYQGRMLLLCARTVLGEPMAAIESEMRTIVEEAPRDLQKMLGASICCHLLEAALLRGERVWSVRIFDEFEPLAQRVFPDYRILRGIASGDFSNLASEQMIQAVLQRVVECYIVKPRDRTRIIEAAEESLRIPFVRFESITVARSTLDIIGKIESEEPGLKLLDELRPLITSTLITSITWLFERQLHPCAQALIDDFGMLADQNGIASWRARLEEQHKTTRRTTAAKTARSRIKLSMLGTIEIAKQDGEMIRPRGARLRTLLGLMVADRLLDKPLSSREFYLLAAGEEDIDRARNTVHVAMHRLRESVGMEEAFTAVEKPRLNLDLFEVDLLEARRLLREGDTAARNGAWMRASAAIIAALALTRNDVPFPSLYDTFFEAAREDFENELRDTVLRVSRGLLDEDDPASAQEILAVAFESVPDDDAIGTLLHTALTRLGRRTEAERVRMKTAVVNGN